MENKKKDVSLDLASELLTCKDYLSTPKWGSFFLFISDREVLMNTYDSLIEEHFISIESPHAVTDSIFITKLMDLEGRVLLLRAN